MFLKNFPCIKYVDSNTSDLEAIWTRIKTLRGGGFFLGSRYPKMNISNNTCESINSRDNYSLYFL